MPGWSQYVGIIEKGLVFFADYTGSAGLSIIIFTIIIKTILLPLTVKALRSTLAMQELQPKVKELQKRYGKDRQALSAETMKLYQESGVNPMSGCLPMVVQIPIFFGLYFAIRSLSSDGAGAWGEGFLWIPDLAASDPLKVLPILAGISQFIQMRMTRPHGQGKPDDPQQRMMQTMMNFMPFMVIIFGWTFAAGPVLYWAISAIYSVIQQWFITGWGSLKDWAPFLPELPDRHRLGYVDPEKRRQAAASGANQKGFFGALNRQLEEQRKRIEEERERQNAESGSSNGSTSGKSKAKKKAEKSANRARAKDEAQQPEPRPDLVPRKSKSSRNKSSAETG